MHGNATGTLTIDVYEDFAYFDALPPRVRAAVREATLCYSAKQIFEILADMGERALLSYLRMVDLHARGGDLKAA